MSYYYSVVGHTDHADHEFTVCLLLLVDLKWKSPRYMSAVRNSSDKSSPKDLLLLLAVDREMGVDHICPTWARYPGCLRQQQHKFFALLVSCADQYVRYNNSSSGSSTRYIDIL